MLKTITSLKIKGLYLSKKKKKKKRQLIIIEVDIQKLRLK